MIAAQTAEFLRRLRRGILDPADTAMLEQASASRLASELKSVYCVAFQERRLGGKWEASLARSFGAELIASSAPDFPFTSFLLVPVYGGCLMLSAEGDSVTGISRLSRLMVRAVGKPERGLALKTGHGFKLDKMPDGWVIKPMRPRTVRLSESFLRGRRWRFDHLNRLIPAP